MDSKVGLQHIVENKEYTKKLATALDTTSTTVKKQVFELLAALCVHSAEGYRRALEVLQHLKEAKNGRYRFQTVVEELRPGPAQDPEYLAAVAGFVNCVILSAKSLKDRTNVRSEFIGLKLLDVIRQLRSTYADNADLDLLVQLDAFDQQKYTDEGQLTGSSAVDLNSHQDVFYAILRQVAESPQQIPFLSILQHLLRIDTAQPVSDIVWDTAEKLVHRATLCESKEDSEKLLRTPSYHHSLNKLLRGIQESGGRCQCSCHGGGDPGATPCSMDGRTRKRTPLQLSFGERTPGILSPTNSSAGFSPELLATLSRAISPPPPQPGTRAPPAVSGLSPPTTGTAPPPPPPPPPPGAGPAPPPPPPAPPPPPGCLPPPPPLQSFPKSEAAAEAAAEAVRLPQQATPRPRNKMRSLNWTKIPSNKVVGKANLWSLIAKAHDGSSNDLDFDTMEGLFCQQAMVTPSGQGSPRLGGRERGATDSLDRKKRESSEINLLDGKRSLNVNIFLKQFRSSTEDIVELLRTGRHAEIGAEKLRGLLKVLPESDEIELLRSYGGERQKLGNAEKFLLQLIQLPNSKLRCEAMLLKEEFPTHMAFLEPAVESIAAAVHELKHCKELHEVLYMLLVAGNFLNSGGYAGDAAGFKMMSLLRVAETRANKPGISLVHYVAQEAEKKFPNLLKFPEYLASLEDVSKLSIDNLKAEISHLSQKVSKILQLVSSAGEDIKKQMQEFLKFATRETEVVQKEVDGLEEVREQMAEFLCEELNAFKLEECFKIFYGFCQKFKAAVDENERRRQQEQRAEVRRRQREDQMAFKKKNSAAEARPSSFSGSESDPVLESLLGGGARRRPPSSSPAELNRMNSLASSLPSEEDAAGRCDSPRAPPRTRRTDADESPDVTPDATPDGTLCRRRHRLSSEDRDDNLMDFLRQNAELDASRMDGGSLDRSSLRRSRRRRPEIIAAELNDRERPASPVSSPMTERRSFDVEQTNKPKQWRRKIEDWLQENEKEQEKERRLRDKINLERWKRQEQELRDSDASLPSLERSDEWKLSPLKNLETLHEAKTDSELYSNKSRDQASNYSIQSRDVTNGSSGKLAEIAKGAPLKDKSKWRKSTLNVANSSESIDDERRRSRSRKVAPEPEAEDTISFYIRTADNAQADVKNGSNVASQNDNPPIENAAILPQPSLLISDRATEIPCQQKVTGNELCNVNERNLLNRLDSKDSTNVDNTKSPISVGRSRFYQSMREPSINRIEPEACKVAVSDDEVLNDTEHKRRSKLSNKKSRTRKDETKSNDDNEGMTSSDKDDESNFDRFSFMRKTTRRTKPRQKLTENECKKPKDNLLNSKTVSESPDTEIQKSNLGVERVDPENTSIEGALRDINQASKEIRALNEENSRHHGSLFSKNSSEKKAEVNEDPKKKDKASTSLKARLSKRLLSLTENLKVAAKPQDINLVDKSMASPVTQTPSQNIKLAGEDKMYKLTNQTPCEKNDKAIFERRPSLGDKLSPIILNTDKTFSYLNHEAVGKEHRSKLSDSSIHNRPILLPKPLKESYIGDTNNIKIAYATPINTDAKVFHSYTLGPKGREEQEKDEGFEETQSQLSEAASQGAGSSYDTDLADSPKSSRQSSERNNAMTELHVPKLTSPEVKSKSVDQKSILPIDVPNVRQPTRPTTLNAPIVRSTKKDSTSCDPTGKLQAKVSPLVIGTPRSPHLGRQISRDSENRVSRTPLQEPRRTTGNKSLNAQDTLRSSRNKTGGSSTLRGSVNETSPKIGRRVAAYTKAIKSMTNNLRGSKKLENYDVTQSMPPTPSDEKKSLASSLNLSEKLRDSKKTRSTSSVSSSIGSRPPSRRSSEKSSPTASRSNSRRSSDRSLNLSRKSSEASVVTVKSANRRSPISSSSFSGSRTAATRPVAFRRTPASKTAVALSAGTQGIKQPRPTTLSRPVLRSNSTSKPAAKTNLAVRRTSSDRFSCGFMKATSASAAKTLPIKCNQEIAVAKLNSKTVPLTNASRMDLSPSRIKQRY